MEAKTETTFAEGYAAALEDVKSVCHTVHDEFINHPKPKNPRNPQVHIAAFGAFEVWKKVSDMPIKGDK